VIHLCVSGAAQIVEVERIREKIVYVDQVTPINCQCGRECRSVCGLRSEGLFGIPPALSSSVGPSASIAESEKEDEKVDDDRVC
jgi:hypothetical protein